MQDVLSEAVGLHQTGHLGAAAHLYQKVLAQEKGNVDALHLYGVLHHQRGDHARAAELIGQAVALRPNVPAFHANLAETYRALGEVERAVGCCRAALHLSPFYPEALCNLGIALEALGRSVEAVEQFEHAVALRPDFAAAYSNWGIALRTLGRREEALAQFRRAIELDPSFPPARTNLGQILLDLGKAELALEHAQEAVRLQPNLAAVHHNLGNVLRALERPIEARAAYLEALRLDPELAQAHAHLGFALQGEGKLGEALPWLKKAVELEPENATFWEYLAELCLELEEFEQAIPCWERVLTLGSQERATPHVSLGWALQEEGRLFEARKHYEIALRVAPDYAGAQLNLGGVHEELGELDRAEAAFREALRLQPAYAIPLGRLATLLRGKLAGSDRAAIEARLADLELGDKPRAQLLFGLAQVLDAQGDYARAADCLRQANTLALSLARDRREYNPAEHEKFVDSLLTVWEGGRFARMAGLGSASRRPVFIFGLPRSGTTLIEQILASHSRVYGAGELRLGRQSFEALPATLGRCDPPLQCLPELDAASIRQLADRHLEKLSGLADPKFEHIVDKMPDNYLYLGLLSLMFPQATFIHCRRSLRDVAVSCWMTDFRSIRWANDPHHIATRFQQYCRLIEHWKRVLPMRLHEVDYEDTVMDLEAVARRLVAAAGLEWEPACLEFHRTQRPVRTASVIQVRQPVHQQSVARWKHYESELAELFAALPDE
jgi:tetratricopeptide (TPR) repeat protein